MTPLKEKEIFGERDKVKISIDRIKAFAPPNDEPYFLAFSGGKDSIVIHDLAKRSGVKFETYYNLTTVDPPALVRFIRENYPDAIWIRPKMTMFQLIVARRYPPTRQSRYCCGYLKENNEQARGRMLITGIRWEESIRRSKRNMTELCFRDKTKRFLHPIIDWTEDDVWEYIKSNKLPYCKLYDEGWKRLGCIMCPMQSSGGMEREAKAYPIVYNNYLKAFGKMIEARKAKPGKTRNKDEWTTAEEVMEWYIHGKSTGEENENEMAMFV